MRYQQVCLEAFGYSVPDEVLTSGELEARLEPLYRRLRLPEGRLELISGIRERRLWPRGMRPSEQSIVSGRRAIETAGIDPQRIGALVHGSVTRDYLEPATACRVHHHLGLPERCQTYDVSNACLGLLNGMVQVANLIELGQIEAGLVVGTEDGRHLLESTIAALNADTSLTRESVKASIASLTIGSASVAILLTHKSISKTQNRLTAAAVRSHSQYYKLCEGGMHDTDSGSAMLMQTDSEKLLAAGLTTGKATFLDFITESGWSSDDVHRSICHQIGGTHRKLMMQNLELSIERDFATFPWLGNTGSVALPISLALAVENGFVQPQENVALLGIGSGLNCVMIAVDWQKSLITSRGVNRGELAGAR